MGTALRSVAALGLLVACAHTYHQQRIEDGGRLPSGSSFLVSMPEPGRFEARTYQESGSQTARIVIQALRRHASRVQLTDEVLSHDAALEAARTGRFEFLVVPIIDHWEDRNTEWSGRPDRVSIRLAVYRTSDETLVNAARLDGTSRWATFGGDHPEELVPPLVDDYVDSLF